MKFIATALLVLTVSGNASALHPPVDSTPPSTSTSTGTGTTVHTTGIPPAAVSAPEPSGAILALIALFAGGGAIRLTRHAKTRRATA